jgi:hypothetical protein
MLKAVQLIIFGTTSAASGGGAEFTTFGGGAELVARYKVDNPSNTLESVLNQVATAGSGTHSVITEGPGLTLLADR